MVSSEMAAEARPVIKEMARVPPTAVDRYWGEHLVCSALFQTAEDSADGLQSRFQAYPLFRELTGLYGLHDAQTILDYGCGPGNDVVGFALYSRAKKIVGVDVSRKALDFAAHRCALHGIDPNRVELIHTTDGAATIPLSDNSIDFLLCEGVIQHASDPEQILREFFRVMKPASRGVVMVYNADSIWLHLYTAYQRLILDKAFPGLDAYKAFSMNVDGVDCPIARAYHHEEFLRLCESSGFVAEYVGGYLSDTEMRSLKRYYEAALQDPALSEVHKTFLRSLSYDDLGFPLYRGKYAGIGGVYRLYALNKAEVSERCLVQLFVARAELFDLRHQLKQIVFSKGDLVNQYGERRDRQKQVLQQCDALQQWKAKVLNIPGMRIARALYRAARKLLGM